MGGAGYRKRRKLLPHEDEGDGEVPGGAEYGEGESTDENDIPGGRLPGLPESDRPWEQGERHDDDDDGVREPEFLEIAQTPSASGHLPSDRSVEPEMFAGDPAEGLYQPHVPDAVDHLAVDRGGLEIGRASCRERGCQSVEISVVARYFKKKKNNS